MKSFFNVHSRTGLLILERGEGEKKRGGESSMGERNMDWLPPAGPDQGLTPPTCACDLTGFQTCNLLFNRTMFQPT